MSRATACTLAVVQSLTLTAEALRFRSIEAIVLACFCWFGTGFSIPALFDELFLGEVG